MVDRNGNDKKKHWYIRTLENGKDSHVSVWASYYYTEYKGICTNTHTTNLEIWKPANGKTLIPFSAFRIAGGRLAVTTRAALEKKLIKLPILQMNETTLGAAIEAWACTNWMKSKKKNLGNHISSRRVHSSNCWFVVGRFHTYKQQWDCLDSTKLSTTSWIKWKAKTRYLRLVWT